MVCRRADVRHRRRLFVFLAKDARASATAPRLNRTIVLFQALGYRIIAETDPAHKRSLVPEIDKAGAEALQFAGQIKQLVPRHAATLERVEQRAREVMAALKPVVDLALSNQTDKALDMMRTRVNVVLDLMLVEVRAVRDQLDQDVARGAAELTERSRSAVRTTYLIVGGATLLALVAAFLVARFGITRPLGRVRDVLLALANGNKAIDIPFTSRGDEVGEVARSAQTFRDNLLRIERMETEQKEAERRAAEEKQAAEEREAAEKKATQERIAAERKAAVHKLADEFEAAVGHVVETVSSASTELEAAAGTLTRTAENTQNLSATVATGLRGSLGQRSVGRFGRERDDVVGRRDQAPGPGIEPRSRRPRSARRSARTRASPRLSQAAGRIGDVVKLITAIAEQTNLLALERHHRGGTRRRGRQGLRRGRLRGQSCSPPRPPRRPSEIVTQISEMQSATQESVVAIKEIGGTITHISEIAETIAAAVEEQGAATQEIARNVQHAAQGTSQVANNIVDVSHGAGETGSASSQVLSSAQQLARESTGLRLEVERFLATVRAA